jgi:hypothetical protein
MRLKVSEFVRQEKASGHSREIKLLEQSPGNFFAIFLKNNLKINSDYAILCIGKLSAGVL